MANRQHSRGRSPSGRRNPSARQNPAGGRTAYTVPVSRTQDPGAAWTVPSQSGVPAYIEPEVRRWPHPVDGGAPAPAPEPALHYIRCALSYQNQVLADIKTLLEQMLTTAAPPAEAAEEKTP